MKIETVMREEIHNELGELKTMELGTDEYKTTVEGITKLTDRVIEMEKLDIQCRLQADDHEFDRRMKHAQMEEERKDRITKNWIAIGGVVLPLGVAIWGTLKSFEFEKEGTITTIMGRGFIQKLLPKK